MMNLTRSDVELINFLSDRENIKAFLLTSVVMSLGFKLTENGKWVKI